MSSAHDDDQESQQVSTTTAIHDHAKDRISNDAQSLEIDDEQDDEILKMLTPSVLASLRATPLLASSWHFVAAATFSVCNRPEATPIIYRYAIEHDAHLASDPPPADDDDKLSAPPSPSGSTHSFGSEDASQLVDVTGCDPAVVHTISQKMREALLKGAALGGLPKTINSLIQLRNATPPAFREEHVLRTEAQLSQSAELARGKSFWDQVYGKVSRRVLSQMNTAYPDLAQYALDHVYSPLLSYTGVLSPKETSYVVIACLIPQDVNPQLKGHLKGGLNNGATKEELMSVRDLSMRICELCEVGWKEEPAKL
ncbi:AhpD-like protein [Myxozyma melibiosi]|uniref:AhpD-like protein n=1 Tax=Myxozyma melibiosi TaxID=54550 RepID=A0ABR1F5H1_9ASCO